MTDVSDLIRQPVPGRPPSLRGRVEVEPADGTTGLIARSVATGHVYEIPSGQWASVDGGIPASGDTCLLSFDDWGDAWALFGGVGGTGEGGGGPPSGPAGGDLDGTYPNPTVVTIDGRAVSAVVFDDDLSDYAQLSDLADYVKTLDLPYVTPEMFGAVGDGSHDDASAFNAAVDALPAGGGDIRCRPKTYRLESTLDLDTKQGVTIEGAGSARGGTTLRFVITGSTTAISARSSLSCRLRKFQIYHTDATWTGIAADFSRHPSGPQDQSMAVIDDVRFNLPQNADTTCTGIYLGKSYGSRIHDCFFSGGGVQILGIASTSEYLNSTRIEGCYHSKAAIIPLKNLTAGSANGNTVYGPTFEPLFDGSAGAYIQDPDIPGGVLAFRGVTAMDSTAGGAWLTVNGGPYTIDGGGIWSTGDCAVLTNGNAKLIIDGNRFDHMTNAVVLGDEGHVVEIDWGINTLTVVTDAIPDIELTKTITRTVAYGDLAFYNGNYTADRGGDSHTRIGNAGGTEPGVWFRPDESASLRCTAAGVIIPSAGVALGSLTQAGEIDDGDFDDTPADGVWGFGDSRLMARIGGNWLKSLKLSADPVVGEVDLATPVGPLHRKVWEGGVLLSGAAATTRILTHNAGPVGGGGTNTANNYHAIYWDKARYAVTGKTLKLLLEIIWQTNATAIGTVTFTLGLATATAIAGTANIQLTPSAQIAGTTVAIVNPTTSQFSQRASVDIDTTALGANLVDGTVYYITCIIGAGMASNSIISLDAHLWAHST